MHIFLDGDGAADRSSSPGKFAFRTATVLAPAACAFVSEAAMLATHGAENYGTVNNTKFAGVVETFRGGFPEPGGNWPCGIGPLFSECSEASGTWHEPVLCMEEIKTLDANAPDEKIISQL
jgi:hypothetical protein